MKTEEEYSRIELSKKILRIVRHRTFGKTSDSECVSLRDDIMLIIPEEVA